jgi:hypothetical protein
MTNLVGFIRALKLLSQMQQEEDRDQRGSEDPGGLALPDSDNRVALPHKSGKGQL